jgi:hypothetical protein
MYFLKLPRLNVKDGKHIISVELKNSGQTPAFGYEAYIGVGVFEIGKEPSTVALPEGMETSRGDLPTGGEIELGGHESSIPQDTVLKIVNEVEALYVYGKVSYQDAFGKSRFTVFRFVSRGEMFTKGRFMACARGNEAS